VNPNYKAITVQDIVDEVLNNPKRFPKGMKTVVVSGDFEGNYTHQLHEIQYDGRKLCLGYEMHEGGN